MYAITFGNKRFGAMLIGMALASGSLHAQNAARDASNKPSTMEKSIESGAKGPPNESSSGSKISTADSSMMRELAKANLAEIQMSGLALSISNNEAVQRLSQKLLDDHTQAMKELRKLAESKGAILPGGVDKEHAAALRQLAVLTGDEFNRQYLAQAGIEAHQQSLRLFQDASAGAKDPELKAYAAKYLPIINQHLQMSQKMLGANQQGSNPGK
jgi:putative membrane protein